jgi:baseplate J-like protein
MTLVAAPPTRTVIDLGADATILDAARRLGLAELGRDVVLVVPAGAPLARNAVFLDVLRRRSANRRLILVSPDARARSLASSVRLRTFASLAALERHELDATERLGAARRAALTTIAASGARKLSLGRALTVLLSLLAAAGILAAVVLPQATITIAASASPIGPFEYDLRAGPEGDITDTQTRQAEVSRSFTSPTTGSRLEEKLARGVERFRNLTTNDIKIPKGTVVQTSDGIRFQTMEDQTLPKSVILPFFYGEVSINIVAIEAGTRGNVAQDRITRSPSPDYQVTNPAPTQGGESNKIPVVSQADYDAAAGRSDGELASAADAQLKTWQGESPKDRIVLGTLVKRTGITPAAEVVGKEGQSSFQLTVRGTATAFSVPANEPRQTALRRLAEEAPSENEIDRETAAKVETVIEPSVDESGVRWRVRATSMQYRRPTDIRAALVGRSFEEADPIASGRGFHIVRVVPWPSWWPRMPVLDYRITVEVVPPVAAGTP